MNSTKLGLLSLAAILAASLTGCGSLYNKEMATGVGDQPAPVAVAAAPAAAPLPDVPKAVADCLARKPPATKTADETVRVLRASDEAKRKCWAAHLAWYRERQAAVAPVTPPAAEPTKKRPAATWE